MPFDPSTVNWDDPRIAPYLQELAEGCFLRLTTLAKEKGIPIVFDGPFDVMNEDIGNTWKACVIGFLEELMPQSPKSTALPESPNLRRQDGPK